MADSNITKKSLANALKELMNEKPFSKINISDICERCDMNRKSFYYHFRDKYDLMNWIFDIEFIPVMAMKENQTVTGRLKRIEFMLDYFYENRSFYRKALEVSGQNSFTEHFQDLLYKTISVQLREMYPQEGVTEFQINLFCDAIIIAVQRWITDKNCMPPREFGIQLYNCIRLIAMRYEDIDSNLLV